jgi:hypothetical protein
MTRPIRTTIRLGTAAAAVSLALWAAACGPCAKKDPPQAAPAGTVNAVEAAKAEYASQWHYDGRKIQGVFIPRIVQGKDEAARAALAAEMQVEYGKLEARLRGELAKKYGADAVATAVEAFKREKGVAPPPVPGQCEK